ncbi:MAG: LysR family transcriptional regulator [Pikeienuella sp.]|uniref:LysR family transcriptional regulator n=1 Tax=Pikeienuella sp. TaxID=2831957 RepID=UPI00391DE31B
MDMNRTDIDLLIALDALLEEESVTRAARRLRISQPAMSARLARLRALFGDRLLIPAGRDLAPTTLAAGLKAPLREALAALDALVRERAAFEPETASATFRLIAPDSFAAAFAPGLVAALAKAGPGLRLALLPFSPQGAWASLETGAADLAVLAAPPAPDAVGRPLYRETFLMAQRSGHPRGEGPPDLEGFCALPHLLVSTEGGGFRGAADAALERLGRARRVVASVPSFLLAPQLLAGSDLVCLLPRRFAEALGPGFSLFEPPLALPDFPLSLFWHPRRQADPAHAWFRRLAVSVVRAGDDAGH